MRVIETCQSCCVRPWKIGSATTSTSATVTGRRKSAGLLEVRAVAAGHDEALDGPAHARLDALELVERPVRVVGALDEQRRRIDALGVGLEAPAAERGIEPDVAPAPEGGVGVVVVAGHA